MSVFVFANKWGVQLFVVTVGAKFYLPVLQALVAACMHMFASRSLGSDAKSLATLVETPTTQ